MSNRTRGLENVQPATRERVRAAMDKLGYSPNRAARALRSGQFHTIGVIMFTLSSYGNSKTLEAIAEAASEADILAEHDLALPADVPVVVIDSSGKSARPLIDTNQAQGTLLAVNHLLDLGHDTVWHITGPESSYSARRREAAWRAALTDAGRAVPPPFHGDWSTGSGYRIGLEIAARPEITAVFVANDAMALGVLRACHESGRGIPESLSIVGFDDMTESESFWPPLTTIRQRFDEVGRSAIELLLREMKNDSRESEVIVPTELVVRSSTAGAPALR